MLQKGKKTAKYIDEGALSINRQVEAGLICPECARKLPYVQAPRCFKCGKEISDETREYCYDCETKPRPFEKNIALYNYDDIMQGSMIQFKYKGRREYARFYAGELYEKFGEQIRQMKISIIIPVPIHKSRLRERGYNQAEEIARELAALINGESENSRGACVEGEKRRANDFPYQVQVRTDILTREKKTVAQKQLDASARASNIYSAMQVHYDLRGAGNILLIDDIYTTGSTLSACTHALKSAGARRVYTATVCIGRDE